PAHGRRRSGPSAPVQWPQALSALFVALTAATFVVVCVVGWMVSYHPLQGVASLQLPHGLSQLWPIIVNGPWLACCLSVLRAALEGRRVVYPWAVLVLFSGFSTALCIADEPHMMPYIAVAGLPPLTAVASLHQLVRQLTLNGADRSRPSAARRASHRMSR
ncbi:DUF2637 domain-containing protein, partial [Kitasatospora sp. NPDC059571]|uniref:DUF2637 domain-containing protein n=1 Tax=Kitasatospora sp. NPDC059571 TaxID=3346871 RepID=UPI0036C34AD0